MNLIKAGLAALLTVLMMASAMAESSLSLDEAKSKGLVGEDANGYLAAVSSPTPEVSELITTINQLRKAEYERIAKRNDISLSDVEALAGRKAIMKSAPGAYVRPPGGWTKKP